MNPTPTDGSTSTLSLNGRGSPASTTARSAKAWTIIGSTTPTMSIQKAGWSANTAKQRARSAMTTTDLLPCPFCGGEARMTYSDRGEVFQVRCNNWTGDAGSKSCMGGGAYAHDEADAIAAWNRRAALSSEQTEPVGAERPVDVMAACRVDGMGNIDDAGSYVALLVSNKDGPPITYRISEGAAQLLISELGTLVGAQPSPSPAGMKVKALEWQQENVDGTKWTGWGPMTIPYHVDHDGKKWIASRNVIVSEHETQAEAKAAAQQDYEQRILSALDPGEPK